VADVLIDACCLINICASESLSEILGANPDRWHVCSAVAAETLYIDAMGEGDQRRRVRVDLEPWFEDGTLVRCAPEGDQELSLYVRYATIVDDGEAMCLAIAESRRWVFASDERKGRRIAVAAGLSMYCTPQRIRGWADASGAKQSVVTKVVKKITTLARYRPSADLPDADWWARLTS